MLLQIQETHESQGLRPVRDFRIASNGIMVRALTQRLYSDPIRSVVRELASNALDASPLPMQVSMPSALDPNFRIRDFGKGLSPQEMEVFTTFGESTKRHTNEQIGGFGLGCKSPFALCNSFTIISYNGGLCTTYIAAIGAEGMPALHEVSSVPSDETGLQIVVPASKDDFPKWKDALDQIKYFDPAPIVDGTPIERPTFFYDDGTLAIPSPGDFKGARPTVLIGPVAYPIDIAQLDYAITKVRYPYDPVPPFIYRVGIGALEVTASREEVVYTPQVIEILSRAVAVAKRIYSEHEKILLEGADSVELVGKILRASPSRSTHIYKDCVEVLPYRIEILPKGKRWERRNDVSSRWVARLKGTVTCYFDDTYILIDDPAGWQSRVLTSKLSSQRAFVITDDQETLDRMGVAYTRVSSLARTPTAARTPKPRTGPAQPRLRGFSGDRMMLQKRSTPYFVTLDSIHPPRVLRSSLTLTPATYEAMEKRLGKPFHFAYKACTRGMIDVTQEHKNLVDTWVLANYAQYVEARAARRAIKDALLRNFIPCGDEVFEFLKTAPGFPPIPSEPAGFGLDILVWGSQAIPKPTKDWAGEVNAYLKGNPLLSFFLRETRQWSSEASEIATLIVK